MTAYGNYCCEEVTRGGEVQPCDKTAVAVRIDESDEHGYAVCAYHARFPMVELRQLLAGFDGGDSLPPESNRPQAHCTSCASPLPHNHVEETRCRNEEGQ